MKEYQFEEIVMLMSVLVMLVAYQNGFIVLAYVFGIKAILDALCLFKQIIGNWRDDDTP